MAKTPKKRLRLTGPARRDEIVDVAAFAFAELGYSAATTQLIAKRCGVSEALLYHHFRSKEQLYRAVMRKLMRQQDDELALSYNQVTTARDYIRSIRDYLRHMIEAKDGSRAAMGHRLMMASLAGDGTYAKLIHRRAFRQRRPMLGRALEEASQTGHMASKLPIQPENAFFFTAFIGAMLLVTTLTDKPIVNLSGSNDDVLRDALLFCARGLGISEELVEEVLAEAVERKGNPTE